MEESRAESEEELVDDPTCGGSPDAWTTLYEIFAESYWGWKNL
jgi:hypothetical protein